MSPRASLAKNKKKSKGGKAKSKKGVIAIERRRHPRFNLELPLDYIRTNEKESYGGIVANASEVGLLAYLPEKMEVGTLLKTEVFYARGLELDSIKATAKIVWADLPARKTWGEHRYGLQFQSVNKGDLKKLKNLLKEMSTTPIRKKGEV